jgi:hypothetical protein
VRECLLGIDDIFGSKWSSAAHLQAHLQQNPLDLTDDKEFKITFYVWLLGGTWPQLRHSCSPTEDCTS